MALNSFLLGELAKRLKPGMRVASMGYPDIIADPREVARVMGAGIYRLKYQDDSQEISRFHNVDFRIPKSESFFELMGATLDVYDIAKHRGNEIVVDLNEPFAVPDGYDIVIDCGTLEHCFHVGTAAINMASMLKKGGIIFHENPFNWANHGFWNINPTFYADFYGQPGFRVIGMWLAPKGETPEPQKFRNGRFLYQGPEANNVVIAERTEVMPVNHVVQWKYRKVIPAAIAAPAAGVSGVKEAA